MNSDPQTLQAFLLALPQLNAPLSMDLQQAVHTVGQALANRRPGVTDDIIRLVEQNPCLGEIFDITYEHLTAKGAPPEPATTSALLVNDASKPMIELEQVAVPILTAHNPITASRSLVRTVFSHWQRYTDAQTGNVHQALDRFGAALTLLTKIVQNIETQERAVLRSLETHPLTLEDLTFILNMTVEQVQTNLESLWSLSEIDLTTSSLWQRLLPILKDHTGGVPSVDPGEYFTLTMKGYFRLHPMISKRYRGMP